MKEELNIGQLIQKSTADVSVSDLSRKGFTKVKVLNQDTIRRLVIEAVERTLEARRDEISQREREKVVSESKLKFEELLKEKVSEEREKVQRTQGEVQTREQQIAFLKAELEDQRKRTATAETERVRLAAENESLRRLADTARADAERVRGEVAAHAEQAGNARRELESERSRATQAAGEAAKYKQDLDNERERGNRGEGDADRLRRELEEARARAAEEAAKHRHELDETRVRGESDLAKLKRELDEARAKAEREDRGSLGMADVFRNLIAEMKAGQGTQDQQQLQFGELKKSLEKLTERLARGIPVAAGQRGGAVDLDDPTAHVMAALLKVDEGVGLDSNIQQVTVKEATAKKGVSGSLEKLKSLQKRGGS